MQLLQQGPSTRLALSSSILGRLAPDVGLDRVQRRNPLQSLFGHGAVSTPEAQVQFPPRPPRVGPACGFGDAPAVVELAPATVGVGLQNAAVENTMMSGALLCATSASRAAV